jgi:hypothetical protein
MMQLFLPDESWGARLDSSIDALHRTERGRKHDKDQSGDH